jgi:hypothetical protein
MGHLARLDRLIPGAAVLPGAFCASAESWPVLEFPNQRPDQPLRLPASLETPVKAGTLWSHHQYRLARPLLYCRG